MATSDFDLPTPSASAIEALAPTGTLRAAINLSNFLLVTGKGDDGNPEGVSPDMARALAGQLGVEVELLRYKAPGLVADDAQAGVWDIGNIGAEPQRATHIAFTAAYCEIPCSYLVAGDSAITSIDQVDQAGVKVSSARRAAYDLWLERNLTAAELVQIDGIDGSFQALADGEVDAMASLLPRLFTDRDRLPGSRILDGQFTAVQQAMGTPRDRDPAGAEYLAVFVEAAKASGLVADAIERHGAHGLAVAPPADG